MSEIIISIQEVIELNHQLEEKELPFKIHLHDACGAQSFSLEEVLKEKTEEKYKQCKKMIIAYFQGKGLCVNFLQNGYDFFVR